jgi:hypothetical protein
MLWIFEKMNHCSWTEYALCHGPNHLWFFLFCLPEFADLVDLWSQRFISFSDVLCVLESVHIFWLRPDDWDTMNLSRFWVLLALICHQIFKIRKTRYKSGLGFRGHPKIYRRRRYKYNSIIQHCDLGMLESCPTRPRRYRLVEEERSGKLWRNSPPADGKWRARSWPREVLGKESEILESQKVVSLPPEEASMAIASGSIHTVRNWTLVVSFLDRLVYHAHRWRGYFGWSGPELALFPLLSVY